jgi:hypothetical protein
MLGIHDIYDINLPNKIYYLNILYFINFNYEGDRCENI